MFRRLLPGKATIGKIRSVVAHYSKSPRCKYAGCPSNYGIPVEQPSITLVCVSVGTLGLIFWYQIYLLRETNYRLMKNRSFAREEILAGAGYYQLPEKKYQRVPNHVLREEKYERVPNHVLREEIYQKVPIHALMKNQMKNCSSAGEEKSTKK